MCNNPKSSMQINLFLAWAKKWKEAVKNLPKTIVVNWFSPAFWHISQYKILGGKNPVLSEGWCEHASWVSGLLAAAHKQFWIFTLPGLPHHHSGHDPKVMEISRNIALVGGRWLSLCDIIHCPKFLFISVSPPISFPSYPHTWHSTTWHQSHGKKFLCLSKMRIRF